MSAHARSGGISPAAAAAVAIFTAHVPAWDPVVLELEFRPDRPYDEQSPSTLLHVRADGRQTQVTCSDRILCGALAREVLALHGLEISDGRLSDLA